MAQVKIKAGKLRRRDIFKARKPPTPDSNGNRAERREAAKKKR